MRKFIVGKGWSLIAGEFPGGSDHELYPLNIVDPKVARDRSPDPRRHSQGEMIPDLVALRGRYLIICEAKVNYNEDDRIKLELLTSARKADLLLALSKFAIERQLPQLLPVESLVIVPTLVFRSSANAPPIQAGLSYLRIHGPSEGILEGILAQLHES